MKPTKVMRRTPSPEARAEAAYDPRAKAAYEQEAKAQLPERFNQPYFLSNPDKVKAARIAFEEANGRPPATIDELRAYATPSE